MTFNTIAFFASSSPIGDLVGIVMNIARILLLLLGGGGGIILIVKGKTDENPKEFQEGLIALVGCGVIEAATFAIEKILL